MTKKTDLKLTLVMSRLIHKILILDRNEKMCHGVTLSQHYILDTLYRRKTMSMNGLSEELGLAVSTVTRIVDILVRDGFLSRKSAVEDRRKVCVELTEKGFQKARTLSGCTQVFWSNIFKSLQDDRKQELIKNLKEILEGLDRVNTKCQMKKNQNKGE